MRGTKPAVKTKENDIGKEVSEIEEHIRQVSTELMNPELALATSVRLSVRQRELQAYLRGILFAVGQAPSWQNFLQAELDHAQHAAQG